MARKAIKFHPASKTERSLEEKCHRRYIAISLTNGLVFHSAVVGGMNTQRYDSLAQTGLKFDPDEPMLSLFMMDGQPTITQQFPVPILNSKSYHPTVLSFCKFFFY